MEYMIIRAREYASQFEDSFDRFMSLALEDGWRPQGGVSYDPASQKYMQAMTRESVEMPDG